jgi:hypothetical protein
MKRKIAFVILLVLQISLFAQDSVRVDFQSINDLLMVLKTYTGDDGARYFVPLKASETQRPDSISLFDTVYDVNGQKTRSLQIRIRKNFKEVIIFYMAVDGIKGYSQGMNYATMTKALANLL